MNILVVYKGIGKIAADQLKKLVNLKDDEKDGTVIGVKDRTIEVIAMEESVYIDNSKTNPLNDKVLFVDNIKSGRDIKPISEIRFNKHGVIYSLAGPQAVLTVNPKKLKKAEEYEAFLKELNAITFQQISEVPRGINGFFDLLAHGVLGYRKRQEDLKKQQLIYGITMFYYNDLQNFLNTGNIHDR